MSSLYRLSTMSLRLQEVATLAAPLLLYVLASRNVDYTTARSGSQYRVASQLPQEYRTPNTATLNLDHTLHAVGAPGWFTGSDVPQESYGMYSWCDMPHVRQQEYLRPPTEFSLIYVEAIQRHHKRTPYSSNLFFREDINWDCKGEGPYHHGKSRDEATAPIYWQTTRHVNNPFDNTIGPGVGESFCTFPAITSQGLADSHQHGADFRAVYEGLLDFLPDHRDHAAYQCRVTHNFLTTQTLGGFAKGLYPDLDEHFALIQPSSIDSLEPAFPCPRAVAVLRDIEGNNPAWLDHLARSRELRQRFNAVAGIQDGDSAGWSTSWDHPYDNLSAKQCHGYPLPCSVNDTALCISQQDADAIYRLGNWEYSHRYRGSSSSLQYSVLRMGAWMTELRGNLRDAIERTSQVRYRHKGSFAHDGSLSAVLGILQTANPVWPGMGAEVVFELWQTRSPNSEEMEPFVRVLWSGQPLDTSTSLGTLDMIKWTDFEAYLTATIPDDLVAFCNDG